MKVHWLMFAALLLSLFLMNCQVRDEIHPIEMDVDTNSLLVLGEQKENPYSLENMARALSNLKESRSDFPEIKISVTDWYIRFKPQNSEELFLLYNDPFLLLWDYPMDYEVLEMGNYYHDPSLPLSQPTYQYTVVKPGFSFEGVEFELLAELFLPEHYPNPAGRVGDGDLLDLENEALFITGNLTQQNRTEGHEWRPSGFIRVTERGTDEYNNIIETGNVLPLVNVKVKAKRWFKTSSGYTSDFGFFRLDAFRDPVDYALEFESPLVKVTDWIGASRNFNGATNRSGPWNKTFNQSEKNWPDATVLNACMFTHYASIEFGIPSPLPSTTYPNGEAVDKLNVRTAYSVGEARMNALTWNELKVWTEAYYGLKTTGLFYDQTSHELGHSLHYKEAPINMGLSGNLIRESWAEYFAFKIVNQIYPNFHLDLATPSNEGYPMQNSGTSKFDEGYTPIFIDLEDPINQLTYRIGRNSSSYPDDWVEGYTITQVYNAVFNHSSLSEIEDYLRTSYYNPTEYYLPTLFDFYEPYE